MIRVFQQFVPKRKLLLILSEGLLLVGAVFVGTSIPLIAQRDVFEATPSELWRGLVSSLTVAALCQVSLSYNDLYDWRVSRNRLDLPNRLLHAAGFTLLTLAVIVFFVPWVFYFPGLPNLHGQTLKLVLILGASFIGLYYWRIGFHWFFFKWGFGERILLLGTGQQALSLGKEIQERPETGFEVAGCVGVDKPENTDEANTLYLGKPDELAALTTKHRISRVIVALEQRRGALPVDQLLACRLNGVRVEEREALYEKIHGKLSIDSLRPSYLIFGEGFRKSRLQLGAKRTFDILLALVGLVIGLPLILVVAIAIRIDSRGPIFFRQRRTGLDGRSFTCLKFRSMRVDAEKHTGPVWALHADDRITKVGRFIRKTRLDELPQMLNVLIGEMSWVGPRPERPVFVQQLSKEIPYYMERLSMRPGLTGWAQINYPYGASVDDAKEKLMYDLYYIKNLRLLFDATILLRTVKVVLFGRGAR